MTLLRTVNENQDTEKQSTDHKESAPDLTVYINGVEVRSLDSISWTYSEG